jgi:hypothetical protein
MSISPANPGRFVTGEYLLLPGNRPEQAGDASVTSGIGTRADPG